VVFKHLNLLETSYFGLKYHTRQQKQQLHRDDKEFLANSSTFEMHNQASQLMETTWLDMDKSALKQLRDSYPMTVYFGVKFYASDPCKLAEEITRYQFFLQCKQDILQTRLPVSFDLAVELFGLAIQSELGDFDPERHLEGYVSEFQFLPKQSLDLERRAAFHHRQLAGQVPATAELNFLERVKWLDLYGCEIHPIQYDEGERGDQYALGLNPSGVLVLRNRLRVAQYVWSKIVKTKCQGRCFLMDVMESGEQSGQAIGPHLEQQRNPKRNRFGFRLADKEASRRLRWSIEEHKSFYFLINSTKTSASLNNQRRSQQDASAALLMHHEQQQQQQQQQQLKFGQRFRQSIRSAISVGAHLGGVLPSNLQAPFANNQLNPYEQQQQHQLRSSMKSSHQAEQQQQQIHQRLQPTVVRMPSRRYGHSSRSLQRPSYLYEANGNGLPQLLPAPVQPPPPPPPVALQRGGAHTMVESQRQQALLMMHQFHQSQLAAQSANLKAQAHHMRSQTLRPSSSKEKRGSHYQQQMAKTAEQLKQQQPAAHLPEISILQPGQHIIQPSIYKALSVVDGINQLGKGPHTGNNNHFNLNNNNNNNNHLLLQQQASHSNAATMIQQIFPIANDLMVRSSRSANERGHESPRSTKSAVGPNTMLKMANKKLANQKQHSFAQPQSLPFGADPLPPPPQNYSNDLGVLYGAKSANGSPRSCRRLARHRSRSTGENLHLIPMLNQNQNQHQHQDQTISIGLDGKMLLTTARNLIQDGLPPPDYNSSTPVHRIQRAKYSAPKKRRDGAVLAMRARTQVGTHVGRRVASEEDEDYYCSRSDCSSIDDGGPEQSGSISSHLRGQARYLDGSLAGPFQKGGHSSLLQTRRHQRPENGEKTFGQPTHMEQTCPPAWSSMKMRHYGGGNGKSSSGLLDGSTEASVRDHLADQNNNPVQFLAVPRNKQQYSQDNGQGHPDPNNNDNAPPTSNNNFVKNITNKQATPILLSMNQQNQFKHELSSLDKNISSNSSNDNNMKAVQLLNMQRQQLNSSSSDGTTSVSTSGKGTSQSSTTPNSSTSSSPKVIQQQQTKPRSQFQTSRHHHAEGSTASNNSTTSGYYAGSNSTGPASVDSDTIDPMHNNIPITRDDRQQSSRNLQNMGDRLIIGGKQQHVNNRAGLSSNGNKPSSQYYLGDSKPVENMSENVDIQQDTKSASLRMNQPQQWSPLGQLQEHASSSLKYVSFDV